MSCKYCDDSNHFILSEEIIEKSVFIMAGPSVFTGEEVQGYEDDVYVFIDRGYLRLAGNDSECLDHGEKVKINFCPLCGEWLTNPEKEDKS